MQSIAENDKSIELEPDKELEVQHESILIDSKNNTNKISDNNSLSEHKRCVPLKIYQKVYEDKQKLLSEINNLNTEIKNLNQSKVNSLENEIKVLKRDAENYENALIKQEKFINILKSKISKMEKQISKKNEDLISKDNTIFELKDKINELTHRIQNMKEMYKIDSEKDFMAKNEEIMLLKNKIEINQKKMEFQEKKYQNLQYKYLKLLKNKKNEIFGLNDNFSTQNIIANKGIIKSRNNNNISNIFFKTPNSRINDDNNELKTLMDSIDINNINNNININVNNNAEFNNIHNNQRYFSPKITLTNKNADKNLENMEIDNKNINNLLPILNSDKNLTIKKEQKIKLKKLDINDGKICLLKSNNNHKKKELNKVTFSDTNK